MAGVVPRAGSVPIAADLTPVHTADETKALRVTTWTPLRALLVVACVACR